MVTDASTSGIVACERFAASLKQDYVAVRFAFELPWSNGHTEGQVHRLKLLKRQMYSRARLDLLRLRMLYVRAEREMHKSRTLGSVHCRCSNLITASLITHHLDLHFPIDTLTLSMIFCR